MKEKEKELREAAGRGDEVRVQQLLAEGVNVNAANDYKGASIHFAAENGHTGTVQALLRAGAKVDARTRYSDWTPLHRAASNGHTGLVKALLTAGADINGRIYEDWTPLHYAAYHGHPECVKVLLKAGANTGIRGRIAGRHVKERKTAEELALQEDVLKVFQLFKKNHYLDLLPLKSCCFLQALQPKVVDNLLTIGLSGKELTSVPAEVFDAKDVERLVLSDNRLTSIPEEIGQLQKLRELKLNDNLLTHLPQAIATLPNLEFIDLTRNSLETLPDGFSRLQLQVLHLHDNRFAEIPEEVFLLPQLQVLSVGGNPIKRLPDRIAQLTGLDALYINRCQFDEFPIQVLQLEGLETLHVRFWAGKRNPSPVVPEDIGRLKNLVELDLESNDLESLPDGLGELSNIRKLDLSNNRISRLPLTLSRLAGLKEMDVSENPLTYPPPDVCEKGTAAIMDFLRREMKEKEEKELRKLFFLFSRSVTDTAEVEALAGALGLTADEMINIQALRNQTPSSQAHKMLLKWIEKDREASMDKLQQELSDIGMDRLAEEAGRIKAEPAKGSADTSGGPPAKRPAAGGSSRAGYQEEHQTEEKIRQKRSKQEVPSVLLVNDEYGTSHRGTSTVNREVAQYLQRHGATVHSTALQASDQDERYANEDKVHLILPIKEPDDPRTPCLEWLTFDHSIRYPDIPQDLKCIVGHTDVTSKAAKRIKRGRCQRAKLVLFNHDMPEDTEPYKGTTKAIAAGKKVGDILEDTKNAEAVFSVGRRIYNHFETKYKSLGENKPKEHLLFLPRPPPPFEATHVESGEGEKVVLTAGRVTEVEKLKGHDLAARAMGEVAEKIPNARLRVRGIDEDDWDASKKILEENLNSSRINPTLLPYGTQEDIRKDMMTAHLVLMPSRAEPFGMIGLEAIAAGIPVLISDKSGLADMITDLIDQNKCPADMRHRIVETSVNETDTDQAAKDWAKKIVDTLKYSKSEFDKAAEFKKTLLESKYWEESHQNLLRVCGLPD
ncbi:ERBIN [Branchiostoma lanceolatum]|uniref:Leucine-rich repeat protein SHOC-2 n=1 Tax=Branchiostoma lanceolatum TaxID=7740 RepID=A0A8J9ZA25_BRALA|nr:ERBIN [Branchiostoma lanceolatum]